MKRSAFTFGISLILLAAWLVLLRPARLGGPGSYVVVSGTSMEPGLHTGDLAILWRADRYDRGDVIAFRVDEGGTVIHRVIGGDQRAGYVTQGDNRETPDQWRPLPNVILGRMWLHLPAAGQAMGSLRASGWIGGSLAALAVAAQLFGGHASVRRRGRMGRLSGSRQRSEAWRGAWSLYVGGVFAVLALISAASLGVLLREPTQEARTVERLRYEHAISFDYRVETEPSTLYPNGTVGPFAADGASPSSPLYTRLVRTIDLGLDYRLAAPEAAVARGEVSAVLELQAGERGWVQREEILPPSDFDGASTTARIALDVQRLVAFVDAVEKETGFTPATYDVRIIPTIHVQGTFGTEAIDDTLSAPFAMRLTRTELIPDSQLSRTDVRTRAEQLVSDRSLSLAGAAIPVGMARAVAGSVGAGLGIIATLMLANCLRSLSADENSRIRARYGRLLVSVGPAPGDDRPQIPVASMNELVRVAQREGELIFHRAGDSGAHLYFVPDGSAVYSYATRPNEE
jgi:signal peptidase I